MSGGEGDLAEEVVEFSGRPSLPFTLCSCSLSLPLSVFLFFVCCFLFLLLSSSFLLSLFVFFLLSVWSCCIYAITGCRERS